MPIPSEAEQLVSGVAVAPGEATVAPVPPVADFIRVGDFVQARKVVETPDSEAPNDTATCEFTVTQVFVKVVSGSPLGNLSQDDGWAFEVIRRAPVDLPVKRATITATLLTGTTVQLIGKGRVWMNEDGDLVDPDLITDFTLV